MTRVSRPALPELERRLARLEGERAILRMPSACCHAIDSGDEEAWVGCFTEDGHFEARGRPASYPSLQVSRRSELRRLAGEHSRPPDA